MRYDARFPTAVFLGPSLDLATARGILPDANYYPPVRLGDVYRLLATGVRRIVIVDGVFHETTPVWPREIVAAMRAGIEVVGATSMGALRAAELHTLGMIGIGRIFAWYRDGVIEGDDEVALLHGDASTDWAPLSAPLVSLRRDLERAVERGVVGAEDAARVLGWLQSLWFGARTREVVGECPVLEPASRARLVRFLVEEATDAKREDALEALRVCAARPFIARVAPGRVEADPFLPIETLRRGLLRADGELVEAAQVLQQAAALPDVPAWRRAAVLRYVTTSALPPLESAEGLPGEGLLPGEHAVERARRRAEAALLAAPPGPTQSRVIEALAAWERGRGREPIDRRARAIQGQHASAWAAARGIELPAGTAEAFLSSWEADQGIADRHAFLAAAGLDAPTYRAVFTEQALLEWIVERGPEAFGDETFSWPVALLRELQWERRASALAEAAR